MEETAQSPWVVRNRIALTWFPAILFIAAIIFYPGQLREDSFSEGLEMAGYIMLMIAAVGRIWCAIYIAGRKNKELATDGPYSICRNPLYVFSFLGMVGMALGAKNVPLALTAAPIFCVYYWLVIRSEEKVLKRIFGEAFEEYRRKVPAVLPKISNYWTRAEFSIHPKKVLTGIMDAMWFLWAIPIIDALEGIKALLMR